MRNKKPQMPNALEAEQALLGGLLIDKEAADKVAGVLKPVEFYGTANKAVYAAIMKLYEQGAAIDIVTVGSALTDMGQLANVGGLAYLNELVDTMPSSSSLETYASMIREKAVMRTIIDAAGKIRTTGIEDQSITAKEYLDLAEALIFSVEGEREKKRDRAVYDILLEGVPRMEALWKKQSRITGVPSGFSKLDVLTAGFQLSDLIILAARPSMGKTAMALAMAHSASLSGVPVGIFSLEMSQEQLSMRLLSMESGVGFADIRSGNISEAQWKGLSNALVNFKELPLYIDDTPALNIFDLRGRARRMVREHSVGIIFVDHLQLIRGKASGGGYREQEIGEISRSLKALAKELNIPIVALAQLNRKVEDRPDKTPVLSDLRESDAIEQDADVIMFLYRDEVYNGDKEDNKGVAEVIIGKQRNGPTGAVELYWMGRTTKFRDLYRLPKVA